MGISALLKSFKSVFARYKMLSEDESLVSDGSSVYEPAERELLVNIKSLRSLLARDVMVPRVDLAVVSTKSSHGDILKVFSEKRVQSIFVYENELDNLVGVLPLYDFLAHITRDPDSTQGGILEPHVSNRGSETFSLFSCLQKVSFISPSMRTLDLLLYMRETGTMDVIVVDEYGGVDGFISFDVLIEEIIGDIKNAHDMATLYAREDGAIMVDGRTRLSELLALFDISFDIQDGDHNDDVDTISGFVSMFCGYVPLPGEKITLANGAVIEILESDARRIKILCLKNMPLKKK